MSGRYMFQIVPTFKCSFNKGDLSSLLTIQINCKYLVCLCFRELIVGQRVGRRSGLCDFTTRNPLLKFSLFCGVGG